MAGNFRRSPASDLEKNLRHGTIIGGWYALGNYVDLLDHGPAGPAPAHLANSAVSLLDKS